MPQAPIGAGDTLSGRLSVKVDAAAGAPARNVSASFELEGDAQTGRLNLSTPLGSTLAQARWAPGTVALVTPQGEQRYRDLDTLTGEVLGESLPVAALFDWLRGRPWPGAPSTPLATPPAAPATAMPATGPALDALPEDLARRTASAPASFAQSGWDVDLSHFTDAWVVATRRQAPTVIVRAKLDRP